MNLSEARKRYGITFKKSLGQNLLLDENINRILVEAAALTSDDDVIEVGAGLGALTDRIRTQARRVLAIEIDRSFMPCLEDRFADAENVVLFRGDVLNHTVEKLLDDFLPKPRTLKMVSNLPYYITNPVLFHFWESPVFVDRMVVMVQEEVGLRMVAPVGAKNYGRLSLAAQYHAEVDLVHKVPASCFMPKPKVDSCIVRMRNRREGLFPDVDTDLLMRVISAAFVHRRKTLLNAMANAPNMDLSKDALAEVMAEAGIDSGRRPQTLSLEDFASLSRKLQDAGVVQSA